MRNPRLKIYEVAVFFSRTDLAAPCELRALEAGGSNNQPMVPSFSGESNSVKRGSS